MTKPETTEPAPDHKPRLSDARLEYALGTINALPFPFMFIDSTHTILIGNTTAAAHFNVNSDKLVATRCPRHKAEKYCDYCPLDDVIKSGRPEEREIFDEKTQKWYSSAVFPVPFVSDEGNQVYILTVTDITEKKFAEENLVREKVRSADLADNFLEVIQNMLELRGPAITVHQKNVAKLSVAIADDLCLEEDEKEGIRIAALVHDIGKISVPSEILARPGRLTPLEYSYVQKHPIFGRDLIAPVSFRWPIGEIIYQHHERMNGSGYPESISGDKIRTEAKIIAVAEVVDAMTTHQSYRPAFNLDETLDHIEANKDTLFDPRVVDACLRLFREMGFQLNK